MVGALFRGEEKDATGKAAEMVRGKERQTVPLLNVSAMTCADACVSVQLVHSESNTCQRVCVCVASRVRAA